MPPKSDAKNKHKNRHQQNAHKSDFGANMLENRVPKRRSPAFQDETFLDLSCKTAPGNLREALDPSDHQKMSNNYIFSSAFVICFSLHAAFVSHAVHDAIV